MKEDGKMYQVGDYVVYGASGPCLVTEITRLHMPGCDRKRKYYVLHPVCSENSTIYSPVDNDKVFMRKVLSKEEAMTLLDAAADISMISVPSEKAREEQYKEILKNSNPQEYIGMIKTLFRKREVRQAQGRKFTSIDERYLQEAEKLLSNEMSISLGETIEKTDRILEQKLNLEAITA